MKRILFLCTALALLPGSVIRADDLKDMISGKKIPLTLKLKDLNADWRRVSIGLQSQDANSAMRALSAMYGANASSGAYYTKGDTIKMDTETWLVAYRVDAKPIDIQAIMRRGGQPFAMPQEQLTGDTVLTLSLLNLRAVGSLNEIRAFDLERETSREQEAKAESGDKDGASDEQAGKGSSGNNLKQLGFALTKYVDDHDETLPPMTDAAAAKKALSAYVNDDAVFVQPASKQAYQPNPSLSRKKWGEIAKRAEVVAFFEAETTDGARAVLFLDGHVEKIADSKWSKIKEASKIP